MCPDRAARVLLCGRALKILDTARTLGEGDGSLVLTCGRGKQLDDNQLRCLIRENGIATVPHGFHSRFRDWEAEETDHPPLQSPESSRDIY